MEWLAHAQKWGGWGTIGRAPLRKQRRAQGRQLNSAQAHRNSTASKVVGLARVLLVETARMVQSCLRQLRRTDWDGEGWAHCLTGAHHLDQHRAASRLGCAKQKLAVGSPGYGDHAGVSIGVSWGCVGGCRCLKLVVGRAAAARFGWEAEQAGGNRAQ